MLLLAAIALHRESLLDYSIRQWKQTPELRVEDAYKWLFHATLGGEHAVRDEDGPRQWLEREWRTLGKPLRGEREIVPLSPDGKIIRVNLRPYKARGGDPEMLLAVFVASARQFHADRSQFVRRWHELGRRLRRRTVGKLSYPEWLRLDRTVRGHGYPAIDHSTAFERAYRPAYRVILRSLW